jgi:hypothetical protein
MIGLNNLKTNNMIYFFILLMYEMIRPKLIWLFYYLINYNDRKNGKNL